MSRSAAVSSEVNRAARRPARRVQPSRGIVPIDFGEIWRYRELLYYLIWRDVKARYKQTFLGGFWAIFRPFASMVLMTVIFGKLAGITSGSDVPYPLFLYAGILPWTYFQSALTGGSSGIANNAGLISKAYFPRVYAPFAAVTAPIIDFLLSFVVLIGLFAWFRTVPSWHVIFLPFFMAMLIVLGLGIGLWLSGVTVRYRDVPFAMPFVIQMLMYATPIIYPISLVPERWRWLPTLNPLTGIVAGVRWALIGTDAPSMWMIGGSAFFTVLLTITGLYFFRRTERTVADHL